MDFLSKGADLLHINFAYATTAEDFAVSTVSNFHTQFWGPFGAIVTLGILIALVGMVYRRIRGTARRPH